MPKVRHLLVIPEGAVRYETACGRTYNPGVNIQNRLVVTDNPNRTECLRCRKSQRYHEIAKEVK